MEHRLKMLQFLSFSACNGFLKFDTLLYNSQNLNAMQIGSILSVALIVQFVFTPLSGYFYDKTAHKLQFVLSKLAVLAVIPLWLSLSFPQNGFFVVLVLANAVAMAGVFAIMDNIVLEYLGSEMSKYGEFRLFGSLGWALGSIVNG